MVRFAREVTHDCGSGQGAKGGELPVGTGLPGEARFGTSQWFLARLAFEGFAELPAGPGQPGPDRLGRSAEILDELLDRLPVEVFPGEEQGVVGGERGEDEPDEGRRFLVFEEDRRIGVRVPRNRCRSTGGKAAEVVGAGRGPPVAGGLMVGDSQKPLTQRAARRIKYFGGPGGREKRFLDNVGDRRLFGPDESRGIPPHPFAVMGVQQRPRLPIAGLQSADDGTLVPNVGQTPLAGGG